MADKKKEAKIISLAREGEIAPINQDNAVLLWSFSLLKEIDDLGNQYWDLNSEQV